MCFVLSLTISSDSIKTFAYFLCTDWIIDVNIEDAKGLKFFVFYFHCSVFENKINVMLSRIQWLLCLEIQMTKCISFSLWQVQILSVVWIFFVLNRLNNRRQYRDRKEAKMQTRVDAYQKKENSTMDSLRALMEKNKHKYWRSSFGGTSIVWCHYGDCPLTKRLVSSFVASPSYFGFWKVNLYHMCVFSGGNYQVEASPSSAGSVCSTRTL